MFSYRKLDPIQTASCMYFQLDGKIKAIFTQGDFVSYTWPDLLYQATQLTKASLSKHFNLTSIIIMLMLYSIAMIFAVRFI